MGTERIDVGKKFILHTILSNDRLDMYSHYIKTAIENDYSCCSMVEFYNNPEEGKHFVLRHDVDFKTPATRKMFLRENSLGVHSTYYFRKSTIDIPLMNQMIANGFEVGFHYETLSDYAIANNLDHITDSDIEVCRNQLKNDIKEFNQLIDMPVKSIVAHGAKKNIEIGESNNVLLEGQKYEDYGVLFEGYDEDFYEHHVDSHIMDGNIRRNYGFSYESNPLTEIENGKKNIVFLSHPNHWYKTFPQSCWELTAFILGRCSYHPTMEFKRIMKNEGDQP